MILRHMPAGIVELCGPRNAENLGDAQRGERDSHGKQRRRITSNYTFQPSTKGLCVH